MGNMLYDKILASVEQHKSQVAVSEEYSNDEIRLTIRQVFRDNPQLFWYSYRWNFNAEDGKLDLIYSFDKEHVSKAKEEIESVVQLDFRIEDVKKLSPLHQLAYAYKWLANYCSYRKASAYNQSIYSVFIMRNSVCTGYAKAFQYLCHRLGFECNILFGQFHNDSEGRHCWNMVKVDERWYHVDVCLAYLDLFKSVGVARTPRLVSLEGFCFDYFCVGKDYIKSDRSIEDEDSIETADISQDCVDVIETALLPSLRKDIRGCCLSKRGKTSLVYLKNDDKRFVIKETSDRRLANNEFECYKRLVGCEHILSVDIAKSTPEQLIVEQAVPLVDLMNSSYFKLSAKGAAAIVKDIVLALEKCYDAGLVYRDIHLGNIFKSAEGTYKLGDFGYCHIGIQDKFTDKVGNPHFLSPETKENGTFTVSSQLYACSVLLNMLISQSPSNRIIRFNTYFDFIQHLESKYPDKVDEDVDCDGSADSLPVSSTNSDSNILEEDFEVLVCEDWNSVESTFSIDVDNAETLESFAVSTALPHRNDFEHDYIERHATTNIGRWGSESLLHKTAQKPCEPLDTYVPQTSALSKFRNALNRCFKSKQDVHSCVYAPAEVEVTEPFLVQVFLYLSEEDGKVQAKATTVDPTSQKKNYIPLSLRLRKGDKITVKLDIADKQYQKTLVWQGSYCSAEFPCMTHWTYPNSTIIGTVSLYLGCVPVGEMSFQAKVVSYKPRVAYAEIITRLFKRAFISYSHKDFETVEKIALQLKACDIDYFLDRHKLKVGDKYREEIRKWIDLSDLFILCWSQNSSESKEVEKERQYAIEVSERGHSSLRICPYLIEPKAPVPDDMIDTYNFEELILNKEL